MSPRLSNVFKKTLLKICCGIACGVAFFPKINSQTATLDPLDAPRRAAFDGNRWAIRDLASFLDHPDLEAEARQILEYLTAFEKSELDWSKRPTRQQTFDFFYKNREKLHFDRALGVWLLTDPEQSKLDDYLTRPQPQPPKPEQHLKNLTPKIKAALLVADTAAFRENLQKLAALRTAAAQDFILALAKNEQELAAAKFPPSFKLHLFLLKNLRASPSPDAARLAILWLREGKFTAAECEFAWSEFFNHYINVVEASAMLRQAQGWLDSFGTIEAVRQHGYLLAGGLNPQFFEEKVDFFGLTSAMTWAQPWARHNAIESLIASHHPRSLFYLSAQAFRARSNADLYSTAERFLQPFLSEIENLTAVKIAVPDSSGATVFASADPVWLLNYAKYWAKHWSDYEWDEQRGLFINRLKAETVAESYERLFRRLAAANDTAAVAAFRSLTEGNLHEISELAAEFRQTVSQFNPAVPSFKHPFLEQMCLLVEACREQNEQWRASERLSIFLKKLDEQPEPKTRYEIENQMIATLTAADLTALEYEALLHEPDKNFAFSAARVLDWTYDRLLPAMLADDQTFRFYLKKSAIFAGIGSNGRLNNYLDRLPADNPATRKLFEKIATSETDADILAQAKKWLAKPAAKPSPPNSKPSAEASQAAEIENLAIAEFQKKLDALAESPSVSAEQINRVLADKLYRPERHKSLILKKIGLLANPAELPRLNPNPKFSGAEDWRFFENLPLSQTQFSKILRLFDGTDAEQILSFLEKKSALLPLDEQGGFLNEVLRQDWVRRFFNRQTADSPLTKTYFLKIKNWHDAATALSDFEEETAVLHLLILENVGKSFAQKLDLTFNLEVEEASRFRLQRELLAGVLFSDLKDFCALLPRLSPDEQGQSGSFFLTRDFGFPPLDFSETIENQLLLKNLRSLSEAEVYKFYLRRFGVRFEKNGELDLAAVRQILRFDLLQPFVGSGGERRDWTVFGLVKILENQFGTRLGFHEKLNEGQTFYTFNAGKRAAAWLAFLADRKI